MLQRGLYYRKREGESRSSYLCATRVQSGHLCRKCSVLNGAITSSAENPANSWKTKKKPEVLGIKDFGFLAQKEGFEPSHGFTRLLP